MQGRRIIVGAVIVFLALLLVVRLTVPLLSSRPGHVDPRQPDLTLHDQRPNQVSSLATDGERQVEPLPTDDLGAAIAAVRSLPRTRLIERTDDYAHLTQRSAVWGFVDDIQLLSQDGAVHIKSSSRLGYSDLGVNARRTAAVRAALADR